MTQFVTIVNGAQGTRAALNKRDLNDDGSFVSQRSLNLVSLACVEEIGEADIREWYFCRKETARGKLHLQALMRARAANAKYVRVLMYEDRFSYMPMCALDAKIILYRER